MYPANFLGLGRGLYFLLPSFLVSRQGPYRGREVFPGTFLRWILYSSLFFDPFFSPHTYPVNFPGLGRGLDFLLPSFLVSRQEKKVGALEIRPIERYSKNGKCTKRVNFSGYNDRAIWKCITFSGYSFHRWNVCRAYAIRPYRVTRKRIDFLRSNVGAYCIRPTKHHFNDGECTKRDTFLGYKDLIIPKRSTFWAFIFNK